MAASLGMALVPASTGLSSLAGNKASISSSRVSGSFSATRVAPRRLAVSAAAAERAASTKESVDMLPNGEWDSNVSVLNYEDEAKFLENKANPPVPGESVELLPNGEWDSTVSIRNYEDEAKFLEDKAIPFEPLVTEGAHGVVSGEWSDNISILSYEELFTYFGKQLFKESATPSTLVSAVMTRPVMTAFPDQTLGEIAHHFEAVSGLPVVNDKLECIGMVTKEDRARAGSDDVKVRDVMTSPALAVMRTNKSVLFAATVMLKTKVHRIPVLNDQDKVVGIVTRSDIFTILEAFQ